MPPLQSDRRRDALPVSVEAYAPPPGGALPLPRSSGVLLHITSLPGPYGAGDLGPEAYRFADFLAETGLRIWQVLPLGPAGLGNSPYSSPSTFALDPIFASPDLMAEDGLLDPKAGSDVFAPGALDDASAPNDTSDTSNAGNANQGYVLDSIEKGRIPVETLLLRPREATPPSGCTADFDTARRIKTLLLQRAFERFEAGKTPVDPAAFDAFCANEAHWLDDFALFMALRAEYGQVEWTAWPRNHALRDPEALEAFRRKQGARIRQRQFAQFVTYDHWNRLKRYCNERDILLFGDIPMYVAHDSADVWTHPHLFCLDEEGRSAFSGGVPPDYFSKTGQHWDNPTYRWDAMRADDFAWWGRRFEAILNQVDLVRLDHFRGFAAYWEIPAGEETAVNGAWRDGPGLPFFESMARRLGRLPLVAEDLGIITEDVRDLIRTLGCPGMAVLQFAFGSDARNPFLPHNHPRNLVLYTGTHDNDTFLGWWERLAADPEKKRAYDFARAYLGVDEHPGETVHWAALRAVLASPADYVVFPMQDLLGLGAAARMNTPGTPWGNWGWRFAQEQLTPKIRRRLTHLTRTYGRTTW